MAKKIPILPYQGTFANLPTSGLTTGELLLTTDTHQLFVATSASATIEIGAGGGGLTYFTEAESTSSPNDTVYVDSITAAGASTNADAVISPKGAGGVLAQVPDGTAAGGNKRGANTVDLQTNRGVNTQVASGAHSVISGGENNTASGDHSVVCGGKSNPASGDKAFIGGGYTNSVAAYGSTIAGGYMNVIDSIADYAFIGGGQYNKTEDDLAVVCGGYSNTAVKKYSAILGGRLGKAWLYGEHAAASGQFAAAGDVQQRILKARKTTTDATPTTLLLDGSTAAYTIDIPTDTTWTAEISVTGRRTDADNESFTAKYIVGIDNNAGTTALVGTVTTVHEQQDNSWTVVITADDTNDALDIKVTGEVGKTIYWHAIATINNVTG